MTDKPRIQDDLYMSINGEWLENAVIPEDRPTTGGFSDLDQDVEKLLMKDFASFAKGEKNTDIKELESAIELYRKVLDEERRNSDGINPILPLLEEIKNLKSIDDFNKKLLDFLKADVELPFNGGVSTDMRDATKHSFCILGPNIILPDTTYYAEGHPQGQQLLQIYRYMAEQVLAFTPLSEEERKTFLDDTFAFDALVSKSVKSQVEWADYVKCYNPTPVDKVSELLQPVNLLGLLEQIYGDKGPDLLVVYDPRAIEEFKCYFNEETF